MEKLWMKELLRLRSEDALLLPDSSEPAYCACGKPTFAGPKNMQFGEAYCDGLYWYCLQPAGTQRSYKNEGKMVYFKTTEPTFTVIQPCPVPSYEKKQIELQKIRVDYVTIKGEPMDFPTFDKSLQPIAYAKCFQYVESEGSLDGKKKLILAGETGRGKTHLARAMFIELMTRFKICYWFKSADLAELFRRMQSYNDDRIDQTKAEDKYNRTVLGDFLFIDDLGAERKTASELFEEQIKILLEEFHGGLIVTTNFNEQSLEERYGEKIMSRLQENAEAIIFHGQDYRARSFPRVQGGLV